MATPTVTTRSGRVIKKPILYEPEEICDDDYSDGGSDDDDDDDDIDVSECETESEIDNEDEDENGNLKGFVVDDSDEDGEDT